MKIALVHDYLKEYGGAERVLMALSEMYPKAPIYTAFKVSNSTAGKEFANKDVRENWLAPLLKIGKLYSPLRFLTPLVWRSFDLSEYDVVITSCSWYITRGFKIGPKTKVIAYCHTPPRWLYGYETSVGFTKFWTVRLYSAIVGHFMRMYDFATAQKPDRDLFKSKSKIYSGVDLFIANSINVQKRIEKFYRRKSVVVYPPVDVEKIIKKTRKSKLVTQKLDNYFLIVSRLVGAKGLEEAAKAFGQFKFKSKKKKSYKLRIIGEAAGYSDVAENLKRLSGGNVELLGRIDDISLYHQYSGAVGFIALARDEDFGMTPVEAQAAGCPVIAYNGGGFKESVVDGVTGVLINDTDEKTIKAAVQRLENINWDRNIIQKNAKKFSRDRFRVGIADSVYKVEVVQNNRFKLV
jgi:glycosyltransferase involved in cell wall biosynthesis